MKKFRRLQSMARGVLYVLAGLLISLSASKASYADTMSFTQPLYHGVVQEKAVSSIVSTDVMMGMWLTNVTQNVRFDVLANSVAQRRFEASKRIVGNFVFLELRTKSVSRSQDVRIRALAPDFNEETFCTVRVNVKDVNDFQPLFPQNPYKVSINEDTKVRTIITHVKATDLDRDLDNSKFYYSLADYTSDFFAVHPATGAVSLIAPLNAKTQASHSVTIQATDRKASLAGTAKPKRTTVTVTVNVVNAQSPEIVVHKQPSLDGDRNSQIGHHVYASLKIRDDDLGLNGQTTVPIITHCDVPGLVTIEPRRRHEYQLILTRIPPAINGDVSVILEVSDRGTPPRTTRKTVQIKIVDKNSLVPGFLNDNFSMTVSEISPVFTQIGFVSAKVLNADTPPKILYSIVSGNEAGYFSINENTSLISTAKRLHRNSGQIFRLTIAATNVNAVNFDARNTTAVSIAVKDANNHDPVFTRDNYMETISENVPIGSVVASVSAQDDDNGINGTVVYSLIDSASLPFAVDPFNGTIYTTALIDSDLFSRTSTFDLRVRASDSGLPYNRKSECLVSVHVMNMNDNPPQFDEVDCSLTVPSSTAVNSTVLQLEPIDIDRNSFSCKLLQGGDGWFKVTATTCELKLADDLTNTENGRQFHLLVSAYDGKYHSDEVVVNVTVSSVQNRISKKCRKTGAIHAFEELMNNLQLSKSQSGDKAVSSSNFTSTSQLPNMYKPKVLASSMRPVSVSEDLTLESVVTRVLAADRDTGYNGKLWYTISAGNDESCFWINKQTGLIRLARSLDRERTSSYSLAIKVSDLGNPSRSTQARISIVVTDVNDNVPVFLRPLYSYEIPENVFVGYEIKSRVEAHDADSLENGQIRYSFSPHSFGSNFFFINPLTGFINVTKGLDRESIAAYNLTVIASDSAAINPLTSTSTVFIRILDVNDNAPKFHQPLYRIQIAEDLPVHAVIFWLEAHDADEGVNGNVRYSLTDGARNENDSLARFHVDDRTGAIRLSAKLDSRVQSRYNITARARDSKQSYSTCFIEIEVLPVNRNLHTPYFENLLNRFEVSEIAAVGTNVDTVLAVDDDKTDPEHDIGYCIVDGTGLGIFSIDQNTGTITTQRSLDRETEQYFWLTVVARDRAAIPLSGHKFVLVEVLDVNDNAPRPSEPMYFARVLENSPVGTVVTQIAATDKDTGGNLTYSMPENKYFTVDSSTGIITTTVKKRLDREDIDVSQLSFDVTISDGLLSSHVRVVVSVTDQNDHDPKFSKSTTKLILPVHNRTREPTPIARVIAFDADTGRNGDIDYVLDRSQKFTISPKSGVISTSKAFKPGQTSTLKISAFDLGSRQRSDKTRLQIEWVQPVWSRNPPQFDDSGSNLLGVTYFEHVDAGFIVDETLGGRTIGVLQATDIDSDQLWFSIVGGNEDYMFGIDDSNALYVAGEPDAETKDFYNLTIQVTDGYNLAHKQVAIDIGDLNDHRPEFSEKVFRASIHENSPVNQRVIQLEVTDRDRTRKNRRFIFNIRGSVDPTSAAKFQITSDGTIYTIAQLDRETQREHVLFVEVDDQGVPGSLQAYCHVVITVLDKNEHSPQFTSSAYFGQILLGNPDTQIGANDTLGKVVVRVQATDQDFGENARIFYSLDSGNTEGFWRINPSTGELTATENLLDEHEISDIVTSLVVKATDGGKPALASTTTVTIDVKRHSSATPRFESEEINISIPENLPRGSFVTMVTATASSGITYSLVSGNVGDRFQLNPHSGVMSLSDPLDREEQEYYHLVVSCVSTEGMQARSRVIVHVTDVNDNRPRFTFSAYNGYVSESSSGSSTPVTDSRNHPLVVSAVDADAGNNARVVFSIVDPDTEIEERFAIDSDTGAIRAKTGIDLFDYEKKKEYKFQVQCFDLGSPRLSSSQPTAITIHVRDANDTIPTFTQSHYQFNLLLPTAEGVIVSKEIHVSKPDPFQKVKPMLMYSISGGNDDSAFKIDPQTGVLSVFNPQSLKNDDVFTLRLRVSDGKRSSAAKATVIVSSIAIEDGLVFTRNVYETNVRENSSEVQSLIVIHVVGVELDDNIRFRILNPFPNLKIGSTSGVISATGIPFDREMKPSYEILVEALNLNEKDESGKFFRRGRCRVKINITDINDCAPEFTKPVYYATVQVDAPPLSEVKQVKATDADQGTNRMINYSLEGEYSRMFDVDSRTGLVTLRRTPDVNVEGGNVKFNITVVASDMGIPSLVGKASLVVTVINQATPVFDRQFYDGIAVSEDAQPHTVVTDLVKASSPDGSVIYFTIEDGDPSQQFDIEFTTGTITTRGALDHEQQSLYRLRIRARDSQARAFSFVEVEVRVSDVNDHAPVFDQAYYSVSLPETASVGTTALQVRAADKDSDNNGRLAYEIVDGDSTDGSYFHIDQDTGVIWTARDLYGEEKQLFRFLVRASDFGAPVRHADVMVTLQVEDVNNNPPVFEKKQFEFEISNQGKAGLFVGKVLATDLDTSDGSKITYSILNGGHPLEIDSRSGVITLADFIHAPVRTNVSVTDGVYSSSASLLVHLSTEDTFPTPVVFNQPSYLFTVKENEPSDTLVGKVSASGSGRLNYRIETESDHSDYFRINARSGRIQTVQIIDREAVKQHGTTDTTITFVVTATDGKGFIARCEVNVRILDVNDNSPIFSQSKYSAVLVPSNGLKDSVLNISAYDLDVGENGRITYSWYDAPPKVTQVLSLDIDEGEIKVRDRIPFGTVKVLQFFVQAMDHGSEQALTNVVPISIYLISDPDSVPRFTTDNVSATVTENAAVGTEIIVMQATVTNNLGIEYALAERYSDNDDDDLTKNGEVGTPKFAIDATSGRITTLSPLDREEKSSHVINVLAYVKTTPKLITSTKVFVTVLDTNDNSPVFTTNEYRASIVENSPLKTVVISVQAFDADNGDFGTVTYNFRSAKDSTVLPFEIDENTGMISISAELDREVAAQYDLVVEAIDGGGKARGSNRRRISTCHVIVDVIDVNDKPPVFLRRFYQTTISENALVGHTVSSVVKVRDGDTRENTKMRFHIVDGDSKGQFKLVWDTNSRSRSAIPAGIELVRKLDREKTSSYTLTILATDGLYSNTTTLRINVGDVNDNAPVCQQQSFYGSVSENLPTRSFVLRVLATDADTGENGRITYELSGEGKDAFSLNSNSGELLTATTLDREIASQYQLTVTASDIGGQSCQMQVFISVDDENDNPPQLVSSSLNAATRENTPINSLIHRVNARDSDAGANGTFVFSLLDAIDDQFYIEPHTGVVILMKPLDRETIPSYQIRVKVQDKGNKKRLDSTGILNLKVLDINDNPPIFSHEQYEAEIAEDATSWDVVAQVSAKSSDIGANARLRYVISGGNEHGKFNINQETGEVRLQSTLDYETDQNYVLRISAFDMSDNPLSSECTLRINVTDVNDNSPEFTSPYRETVPEDIDIGHLVVTVSAVDRDSGPAGDVSFRLSPSNSNDLPFLLDTVSGKLTIASPGLDFERKQHYRITVIATDSGIPRLESVSTVEVIVEDVNDNRPHFDLVVPPNLDTNKPVCSQEGSNCTVFVHEGTTEAVTLGLVLLNATDKDGIENGGPFQFRITEGNENGLFYLDDDNVLKARRPLELDTNSLLSNEPKQKLHRLKIEATDSGKPVRLSSDPDLELNIVVLKENQYPPVLTPHRVQIATPNSQFEGDMLTQHLHAIDRDTIDQNHLRFSMASPDDFERYLVDPLTGSITSLAPLETGVHNITVRVSDGSRYTNSTVSVQINHIDINALESSVAITFSGIRSSQEYLSNYHSIFVTKLSSILPFGVDLQRDLVIMSLQENEEGNIQLLFGIRNPTSKLKKEFYSSKALKRFLENSRQLFMADGSNLQVEMIEGTSCPKDHCSHGACSLVPTLGSKFTVVSTNLYSLITPAFHKEERCVCPPGTTGEFCESICSEANNPCPKNRQCVISDEETNGYRCDPAQTTNTVMAFSGHSYAKYVLKSYTDLAPFQISLRLRTFQSNSTIFYATGSNHFARLETASGLLQFTFDCGSGSQTMKQDQKLVNDGKWTQVDIESRRESNTCAFKMTIDGTYRAGTEAPYGDATLEVTNIDFGGTPLKSRGKRSAAAEYEKRDAFRNRIVQHGYRGCIKGVAINGSPLLSTSKSTFRMDSKKNVLNRCTSSGIEMGACVAKPCQNGGRCLPLSDGLHECECMDNYYGEKCENFDPCGSLPCSNKGYCYSDGQNTQCVCNSQYTGSRCEIKLPVCASGFQGLRCDIDVNECESSEGIDTCGGKDKCFNYPGGFACNCESTQVERRDPKCDTIGPTQEPKTASPNWTIIAVIGGAAVILIAIVVVLLVVCCRKRNKRKLDSDSLEFSRMVRSRSPPRIPPPPNQYQRSSRDSYNLDSQRAEDQEQQSRLIGYVQPQLPVSPSMSGASDSDSLRKPSPSWPEYDPTKYNESTTSSVQHFSVAQKASSNSIVDQQSYDWDVTDWKLKGSGVVPQAVARVAVGSDRVRGEEFPSSPLSQRSFNSVSTNRSRRGHHRTDALAGHYNKGRARGEKQLLQFVTTDKQTSQAQEIELQHYISSFVKNMPNRSINGSLRSASSRNHQPFQPMPPVESSYPSSSHCASYSVESPSSDVSDEYPQMGVSTDEFTQADVILLNSSSGLPPPPSEYELQNLREEDEDDILDVSHLLPATNKSYSSLLNSPYSVDPHTPAVARSMPFRSGQHLVNLCNVSDLSLASEVVHEDMNSNHPETQRLMPLKTDDLTKRLEDTPSPPQRHDSERLAMSSLSDDEETEFLHKNARKKNRHGRPPLDPKAKVKRGKKKSAPKPHVAANYYQGTDPKAQGHIFLDRPSPGTTDV